MVSPIDCPRIALQDQTAHRLVNSKFPPISLFDDVASEEEFEVAFAFQALVNPRIQTEVGDLALIPRDQIPFGIPGCSYATAPFTHINPDGSRFSNGDYGVLYLADTMETALAEVEHHQNKYWSNISGLHYDRFIFRGLTAVFSTTQLVDATHLSMDDPIYNPDSYGASQEFGKQILDQNLAGLQFHSVRHDKGLCWGLMTPSVVSEVKQTKHYAMIWSEKVVSVEQLSRPYR